MKLTLTDLVSLANETSAVQTINDNFAAIETAMENTFSRDGTSPNYFSANVDANSYRITNLPTPTANTDAATKGYVDDLVGSLDADRLQAAIDAEPLAVAAQAAAESAAADAEASAVLAASYVGSALSAQKWSTARTITFSGVSTSVSPAWDGSGDLVIPLELVDDTIDFAKLLHVGESSFLGRVAGVGEGALQTISAADAADTLPTFSVGNKGVVPAPTAGDTGKYLKGDGTWGSISVGASSIIGTFGSSGYAFIGSLCLQWGRYDSGLSTPIITFPIPFPNDVLSIQVTAESALTGGINGATLINSTITANDFRVRCTKEDGGGGAINNTLVPFTWFAIGY